jgi:tetratricopeptide (TPR) repeat protein
MQAHAYEEAAAEYQRALHAVDLAGPGGADDGLRCELLLLLGAAQVRAGRYPEAKAHHLQAVEIARRLGATDLLARATLGFGEPHVEGGHVDRQLVTLLREALDALPDEDSPLRARLLARLSVELTFSEEVDLTGALSQEAVEMARRLGDARALGAALDARWMAVWGPDGLSERAALAEESLHLAQATGDRDLELHSLAQRVTSGLESGDFLTVEADIAAYARVADDLRMPVHQWVLTSMRAMRALLLGLFAEAEPLIAEAFAAQPERPNARWANQLELTLLRWEQGRLGELYERWHTQVERFPRLAMARAWLALADLERGDREAASRASQILAERLPKLTRTGLWLPGAVLAAQVAARLDDAEAARALYPVLLPYAEQAASMNMEQPVVCFGVGAFYLGMLATVMSSWDEAERHFETAVRIHERIGAAPLLARTRVEYARMLLRRGQGDDQDRATALLTRAEGTAESLGLVELAGQIVALRQAQAEEPSATAPEVAETQPVAMPQVAASTSTPAPASAPRDRFQREGELWTVSFDGKVVHLKDSKGLRQLAHLLAQPGRELHATDLEALVNGPAEPSTPGRSRNADHGELGVRADFGDAGELLDAEARTAYKARLDELQEEIDEAEDFNDSERAERAREEREFLIRELARAVGLGGRDRKAASHAERARLNATRAIRSAMTSVAKVHPALGEHLAATIRTGRYCSYTPDPRSPVHWEL